MTSLEIHCPGCNVALKVSPATLGKKGRCRSCGANFPIRPDAHAPASQSPDDLIALGKFDRMLIDPPRDGAMALSEALVALSQTRADLLPILLRIAREVTDEDDLDFGPETQFADIEEWESLNHIHMVVRMEDVFGQFHCFT